MTGPGLFLPCTSHHHQHSIPSTLPLPHRASIRSSSSTEMTHSPASGTTSTLRSTSKYIFYDVSHSHKYAAFRQLMMLWDSSLHAMPCWAWHPILRCWVNTSNRIRLQKSSPSRNTRALSDRINTENLLVCREYDLHSLHHQTSPPRRLEGGSFLVIPKLPHSSQRGGWHISVPMLVTGTTCYP